MGNHVHIMTYISIYSNGWGIVIVKWALKWRREALGVKLLGVSFTLPWSRSGFFFFFFLGLSLYNHTAWLPSSCTSLACS